MFDNWLSFIKVVKLFIFLLMEGEVEMMFFFNNIEYMVYKYMFVRL